ncbi:MAG: hypothetical protein ACE1ZU_07200, partial [bacterium]
MSVRATRWVRPGLPIVGLGLVSLGLYGWIGLGEGLPGVAASFGVASPFSAFVIVSSILFLLYGAAVALLWRMEDTPG